MSVQTATSPPSQSAIPLPDFDQLSPRQQIAVDCARCARPLGMNGRKWGEIRHRGFPFVLWICGPGCAQAVHAPQPTTPHSPPVVPHHLGGTPRPPRLP
ncbi:hypothetical protein QFZ43_005548 [Streptomyces afghaniensis]|nr:hypothetical protein [Streptomyces afghaniensis]